MTIWSMSSSCGLRGGSCGSESAGGSIESVSTGSRVARSVVEKASVSFGSVQICSSMSAEYAYRLRLTHLDHTLGADEH